jgi:ribosomal protein L11 methyltransferase
MPLTEFQLLLPADDLDAWSDALLEAGAVSVSIEDDDSDTADEVALYGEPGLGPARPAWRNNRVTVLVDESADAERLVETVARSFGREAPAISRRRPVEDRDWVRQTQSQFAPISIGRIAIVPSWHVPPEGNPLVIRIDPGVAFGTGTHPTTRLCLSWLDEHPVAGRSVLDYGCGSGILSICASLLGAAEVVGVDIDPQAVATARANAQANGARAQYTSPESFAADASRRFDIVMANILANPIMLLAPALAHRVAPGGTLLLSGILERQQDEVIEAYRAADPRLALRAWRADDGWVAIVGQRQG